MTESLLDFYRRHRISPVRQDVHDLAAHFRRRAALYRHLGILPAFVHGRRVLEIGPGSGFNSLYTASLEPARYVLVEGNPRGVEDIRRLFTEHPTLTRRTEIVGATSDDYSSAEGFDFVFCEGMLALAGVPDPGRLLWSVARHVAPGGLLVITCIDPVSDFSEVLRRFVAQWLIDPAHGLDDQAEQLVPIFSPHLSTLSGMNRRHDDWVIDNLLNPASIGPMLAIPDAVAALDRDFDVFGSSPRFLTDWRWYKAISVDGERFNELALDSYWANVHNLIDYRKTWLPRDPADNRRLYDSCVRVRETIHEYERSRNRDLLPIFLDRIETVRGEAQPFSASAGEALADLQTILTRPSLDAAAVAASRSLAPWFGRGQQYLSFSRRQNKEGVPIDEYGVD